MLITLHDRSTSCKAHLNPQIVQSQVPSVKIHCQLEALTYQLVLFLVMEGRLQHECKGVAQPLSIEC